MTSGPCVPIALEKENAVADYRMLIGATDPKDAAEGTRITAPSLPFELAATPAMLTAFTKATGLKSPAGHTYVTESFNAANVFLDCIKKGNVTRPGIQKCIATGTFTGADGSKIVFTRYGEITGGAPIGDFVIKGGKIVYNGAVK